MLGVVVALMLTLSETGRASEPSPAASAAEPASRLLRLPTNLTAAAVNPDNGDVAFVSLRSGQLWLLKSAWFDGDAAAKIGPMTSVENPSWVAFKQYEDRTFVVVGCFAAGPVRVFDADTLQGLRFPHNTRADALWLSVSRNPADPLIYVSARTNDVPAVHVVNLAAQQLQLQPLLTFGRSAAKVAGAVVSHSGRTLYKFGDDDQRLTAFRVRPPESPDKPPRLERLADHPDDAVTRTQPPIALPYDLGLVDGDAVVSPDTGPARTLLPGQVSCVQDDQPLALALSDRQLRLVSLTAPRVLATRPLAAELSDYQPHEREIVARPAGSEHRFVIRPVVLADPGRKRILALGNRDVQILPSSVLPHGDDVWLGLEVDLPRVIPAGKPWATRVRKTDPRAKVQLQSAPDGMTLRDDELAWTPPPGTLGPATFTLQLERDGSSVRHALSLEVKGGGLTCPFPASQVAVDPDRRRLIVWTNQGSSAKLALIDSAVDVVVAERTVPGDIIYLRIAPRAVCLISTGGRDQELLTLDPETLQTKARTPVKVSEYRQKIGGDLLQLRGRDQIVFDKCYSLPDLKEITPPKSPGVGRPRVPDARPPGGMCVEGRVNGGWCQEGVIWDETLSQPRALLGPADFLQAGPAVSSWDNGWIRRPVSRAGSFSAKETVSSQAAQDTHSVALTDLPIVLEVGIRAQSQEGAIRVELVARKRIDRQEVRRWPIDMLRAEPKRSFSYCLATDGLAAGMVLDGRVYAVDLSELQSGTYARPLAFVPDQGPVLAAADGPTRLKYRAVGGQPPYTLKALLPGAGDLNLVRPVPAGSLELEVDVAGYIAEQKSPAARALVDQSVATEAAEAILNRYRQAVTPAFRRLTGRDPAGVPVAMPLEVRVLDSGSQSAKFCHYLLVDVPPDTLAPPLDAEIASRWKGTTTAAAAQGRMHLHRWREFGDKARREHAATLDTAQLEAAARQAFAAVEARWQETLFQARLERCRNAPRMWTTTDGRTARARLLRAADGVAVLVTNSKRPFEVPLDRLSSEDQQYVRTTALNADAAAREAAEDVESQLRVIGGAVLAFKARHTHMPPQALAGPDGTPALSWRVLLLPHLDAAELYALFRLDEPWDSAHNRQLLKHMPPVYRIPGVETEPGQTAVVGLFGPQTLFPPCRLVYDEDCRRHPASVALAVVAAHDHAVAWTQPVDLPVNREGHFAEQLDWRDNATIVLMRDGSLRRMPRSMPADDWLKTADRDNGSLGHGNVP